MTQWVFDPGQFVNTGVLIVTTLAATAKIYYGLKAEVAKNRGDTADLSIDVADLKKEIKNGGFLRNVDLQHIEQEKREAHDRFDESMKDHESRLRVLERAMRGA